MKIISRLKIQSEVIFVFLVTLLMLSLHLYPLIKLANHTPKDRVFSYVHNNIQDFYFYQALMNEGASGQWLTTDPFTTEPHSSSVIFSYFLWLGKVAAIFHISFPLMYHLSRILLGIGAAVSGYLLFKSLKLPYKRLAYIFFVFATPFLHQIIVDGNEQRTTYMFWWTGIDAIRRFAYLPHHMFGSFVLILNVLSILRFFKTKNTKLLVMSLVCCLLLGFIHPPSLFILLLALPVALLIYTLTTASRAKHVKTDIKAAKTFIVAGWRFEIEAATIGLLIYWVIGVFLMILMVSQTNKGFPWSQYIGWEKRIQFPLDKELFGALGILFPFAVIGGVFSLFSRRFDYIFVVCWLFVPFLFIPFAQQLNISNIRLIQGTPYLPLAILAILGIKTIEDALASFRIKIPNITQHIPTIPSVIFVLFLFFTIPTLQWSIDDQIREFWNIWTNVYLDKRYFPSFDFINATFPPKTKTFSTFYVGNYLPVYTHTQSYSGHFGYTLNREAKETIIDNFFRSKLNPVEAKKILIDNNITLVYQGLEEKPLFNGLLYPEFLKPVYDNSGITIYTLK